MALVIGDLQTARRDAALQEPMEKQYERDQSCHPQGLLLLPELGSDFQHAGAEHMAPSTTLSSCLHPLLWSCFHQHCAAAAAVSVSVASSPWLQPLKTSVVLSEGKVRPCMVPVTPQVVRVSQAWAAEEVVVLASSTEHFRLWSPASGQGLLRFPVPAPELRVC